MSAIPKRRYFVQRDDRDDEPREVHIGADTPEDEISNAITAAWSYLRFTGAGSVTLLWQDEDSSAPEGFCTITFTMHDE